MANRPWILATCLVAAAPALPLAGQDSTAYSEEAQVLLPDSLDESYDGGRFVLSIRRAVADSTHAHFIRRAERLYPSAAVFDSAEADALRSARRPDSMRARLEHATQVGIGPRWWWWSDGPDLVPFAVTDAAVAYYLERYRELAVTSFSIDERGESWPRGHVEYSASARIDNTGPEPVYVVTLKLRAGSGCGSLCGRGFTLDRSVFFDQRGVLLRVEGDGHLVFVVS